MTNKKDNLARFHRQNIIEAAKKLFAEGGIKATTMDEIAKEAQYSKSTVYVYFKSKEEIYNHIVYDYMLILKESLIAATDESKDFESNYLHICETLIKFQETYPLFFESISGHISIDPEDFKTQPVLENIYNTGEYINHLMLSLLHNGIKTGQLRPDIDPIKTVFTFWSSICGLISFADKKENYIKTTMLSSKQDFFQYSVKLLLRAISISPKEG